jgi:MFS family permease
MPGGGVVAVTGTADVSRVEAPVTLRAYLIVAFAAFGGIFFGYDTGWMGGVLNMDYFIKQYTGNEYPDVVFPNLDKLDPQVTNYRNNSFVIVPWQQSLVTSILSAGTFFGAIIAGDLADIIGRRFTIILGCAIFCVGGILECASTGFEVMTVGRLVAGFGVGFISSVVILYMSEIAPKKVRGAVVAGK